MRVAMFVELGKVELQDMPRPSLHEGEVLVEIDACGLCATDVKSILKGHVFWKPPRVLGHEMVGTVVETRNQDAFSIGDRVALAPAMACGSCYFCRRGSETLCINRRGQMPDPGGFAEYVRCPVAIVERGMMKLPPNVTPAVGTLAEPLACALRAMKMAGVLPGSKVVIVGDGPMGMMNAAAARLFGASLVIQSGTLPHRLDVAGEYYADIAVNVKEQNIKEVVLQHTEGHGADAVFVTVTAAPLVQQSIDLVRPGGVFNVFAGQPADATMTLDLGLVHYKEVTVMGTFGGTSNEIYEAVQYLGTGRLDFSPVVSKAFPLSGFMDAMTYSQSMEGLRAVIVPDGKDPFVMPS